MSSSARAGHIARRVLSRLGLSGPARVAKTRAEQAAARARSVAHRRATQRHSDLINFWDASTSNNYYDILTAAVIRRVVQPDDLAIDIGAHTGDVLHHMIAAAPEVAHIAIEPLPHLAAGLRERFPMVEVHEVALVSEPAGPLQFHHVATNPAYSGIRQRSLDRPDETVELIDVETARLDDVVDPSRSPAIIKLDVEGAEYGVLAGAPRILETDRPVVVFEHGLGAADHYDTTPQMMFDLFAGHRYELFLLGTWMEAGPALTRDQFIDQFEQRKNYYFLAAPT